MLVLKGHCPNSFRPPPSAKQANVEKKVPQTILASPYTPRQRGKKVPQTQTILASLFTPPPLRAMPIWKQHISKRGFPNHIPAFKFLRTGKKRVSQTKKTENKSECCPVSLLVLKSLSSCLWQPEKDNVRDTQKCL